MTLNSATTKTSVTVITVVLAGLIAAAPLFGLGSSDRDDATRGQDRVVVQMTADYPLYADLPELVGDSTLVVRGRVVSVQRPQRVLPSQRILDSLPQEKREQAGFMTTDVIVQVDKVLAGAGAVRGSTVSITHLGGTDGQITFVAEGDPVSQAGRSYVFFLREGADGRFAIVGGNQGRFTLAGAGLDAVAPEALQTPVGVAMGRLRLASLENTVDGMRTMRPLT